jgi:hypothetical protein
MLHRRVPVPGCPGRYYIQSSDVHHFNDPRVNFIAVLTAITFIGCERAAAHQCPTTKGLGEREWIRGTRNHEIGI